MEKAKKTHLKKYLSWVLLAALVVLLAAMPLMAQADAEEDGPVATVYSGTAAIGSVTTTLHGGGTLTADDAEDVTIPSGVKITEFLVKNGDSVTAGTPLAAVDKVSVMTAIVSVTETMEYLQDEISSSRSDTISGTLSATAGGRVKKVFAKAGEAVQDVMLRDGCLALLSIDGLMAVKLERNMDITTGESVCVTFRDDTEVTGRVESNLDGVIIVTIDDEGYEIGESVTVTTDDGDRIGSGTLYVHNAWKATGYSGTVSTVYAKEETKVSSGATLFTLKDTDYTAQMEYLSALHREYEELLQELFQMYESGTINAPCDGTVSGVDKDSTHLLASETIDGEQGWYVDLLANETENGESGWTVMLLGSTTYADGECGSNTCTLVGAHTVEDCPKNSCTLTSACAANPGLHKANCYFNCTGKADCPADYHQDGCLGKCTNNASCLSEKPLADHGENCIKHCTNAAEENKCTAHTHYPSCIELCDPSLGDQCPATVHKTGCYYHGVTYTAMAAKVFQVGNTELITYANTSVAYEVAPSGTGWRLVNPTSLPAIYPEKDTRISISDKSRYQEGDIVLEIIGKNSSNVQVYRDVYVYQRNPSGGSSYPGTGDLGSMGNLEDMMQNQLDAAMKEAMAGMDLSSMIGGFSGYGNYGMTGSTGTSSEPELFDLDGSVLMTVTPHDTVSLTITLDEQDIAKVSVGQTAEVKVEALKGEVFEAEVVEVGKHGTNSGGSSKFTAKLRLAMHEDMLDGMSATASLPLSTKMDVLTIPVEALVDSGAKTLVYTALDEDGQPTNPVEVVTGVSDGSSVEILSGLSSGDPFYYSYYDVLELDTNAEVSRYSFG